MAKEPDIGMDKAELKSLLAKSKQEPVNCALGKGKEPGVAFILMHKSKQPMALEKELEKQFKDMTDPRRGTAFVDIDENPKLVNFRINKPSSGLPARVLRQIKVVGFNKVRFEFEDGSPAETHGEDEEAPQGAAPAAAPPPPPPPAPPQAPQYNADEIKHRLTALVQMMIKTIAADPSRKDALTALAKSAQIALGTNNFATAIEGCDALEAALAEPAASHATEAPHTDPHAAAYAKSAMIWAAVRRKIEADLGTLRQSILATFKDTDAVFELDSSYSATTGTLLETLDNSLAEVLDQAAKAADEGERVKLVEQAHEIIQGYRSYIDGEPLFGELDSNPFVPLKLTQTLTGTLTTLAATVK